MTCTCNQSRELDEYGPSYEGDFVEDFEAMLEEMESPVLPDKRVRNNSRAMPFRYICNLEYGSRVIGSATLIGPSTVLTTAHLLFESVAKNSCEPQLRTPSRFRITPGREGNAAPFASSAAAQLIPFPHCPGRPETDIGILHQTRPLGRNGHWTREEVKGKPVRTSFTLVPQGNTSVNLSGYALDKPDNKSLQCYTSCMNPRSDAPKRSSRCGTYSYSARNLAGSVSGRALTYTDRHCRGLDGAAVWMASTQRFGLVGVHSDLSGKAVVLDVVLSKWIACNIK